MVSRQSTVLITGCSAGGLGEALALTFHARGARVLATARDVTSMEILESKGIETFALDVTYTDSIVAARAKVESLTGGHLDVLVNNAGVAYPYPVSDWDMSKVRALFDVNLFGAMEMVHAFIPLLLKSNRPRVVQVSSLAGLTPLPFGAAYNASKAALLSFSDTLRVELAPFNIQVISPVLGNLQTNITKPWHVLPENSIYQPIQSIWKSTRVDHFQDGAFPREPVARNIVNETLKESPRAWLWGGKSAWLVWFISTFGRRTSFDRILSKMFGLDKLAAMIAATKKNA